MYINVLTGSSFVTYLFFSPDEEQEVDHPLFYVDISIAMTLAWHLFCSLQSVLLKIAIMDSRMLYGWLQCHGTCHMIGLENQLKSGPLLLFQDIHLFLLIILSLVFCIHKLKLILVE